MSDELRIRKLLEEVLDSKRTPEEVCRECPELLEAVREQWERLQSIDAQIEALFPTPGQDTTPPPGTDESELQ